jgi:hypothetical protein
VINIKQLDIDTIIVLDGGVFKTEVKDWLRSQVSGCLKKVVNLSEFMKIANK